MPHNAGFATPLALNSCRCCLPRALSKLTASSYRLLVDTHWIYDGTDENGIVGTVAPGLFAQRVAAGG